MIKINNNFTIQKYRYGWELHHTTPSKDKDGNPSESVRITYHPSIRLVLLAVIDRASGDCTELVDIVKVIERASAEFRTVGFKPSTVGGV